MAASTAAECKNLGRKVSNFDMNLSKEKCKDIMKDELMQSLARIAIVLRSWKLPTTLFLLKHLHIINSGKPELVLRILTWLICNYGMGIICWVKFLKKLGKI